MNERRPASSNTLLRVKGISAGYGQKKILNDVSFTAAKGETVLFIGHNGAGKSTILKAVMGLLPWVTGGVEFDQLSLGSPDVNRNVRSGINIVLQQGGYFPNFSVVDNLKLGGFSLSSRHDIARRVDTVLDLFPELRKRKASSARLLSGGEQKMLSIGMALMTEPKLLLVDEPSAGLAPRVVTQVLDQLRRINEEWGTTILLVEQNVAAGLSIADTVLVVKLGSIVGRQSAKEFANLERPWELW